MNTSLSSKEEIKQAFDKIYSFDNQEDEIRHRAKMLMFCFLQEIEKVAEKKKLKKKDLAKIIGTSPSYITQLFRGDKLINLETLAKLEEGLGIKYEVKVKYDAYDNSETSKDDCKHNISRGKTTKMKRKLNATSS